MDTTRTILAVIVECGKKNCRECRGLTEGHCDIFDIYLDEDGDDVFLRCEPCLEAQARADDMMLKTAMAKAAPQQG